MHISLGQFTDIIDNTILNNGDGINIQSFATNANTRITGNIIRLNNNGIVLLSSSDNAVTDNTIESNQAGIFMSSQPPFFIPSRIINNRIFNNNLINNTVEITTLGIGLNFFDNGLPDGGNFWDDYDEPTEGCNDANNDGFCDAPRVISSTLNIKDNFPWTERDGWKEPTGVDINLSWSENTDPDFESYRIFRDTSTGVDLNNTLVATITDQSQTSFVDQDLDTGVTYFYKVFVFDKIGLSSGSNEEGGGL